LRLYFGFLARAGIDGRLRELVQTIHCLIAEEFECLTGEGVRAALGHDRYRAPGRQPYCAGCCDVWTANSRTPACGYSLRGSAVLAVTLGTPSTRKLVDAVPIAAPTDALGRFTRAVSWPVAGYQQGEVDDRSILDRKHRDLLLRHHAPTSVLVVSTHGCFARHRHRLLERLHAHLNVLRVLEADGEDDVLHVDRRETLEFGSQVVAPGLQTRKRYLPSASVTELRATPVSALVTVSVTPGSTPPCVSAMVPAMAPLVFWAVAGVAPISARIDEQHPEANEPLHSVPPGYE
jgi:hypothetical protein